MAPPRRVVLASASPRRARILESLGVAFRVSPAHVDEAVADGEQGAAAAERLARAKAAAVAARETLPVVAADTVVVCEGEILGKPVSEADAARMLRRLSGRTHEVVTGVCVAGSGALFSGVEVTRVTLTPLAEEQVSWYVGTEEPLDKAGAYHVDGLGALFVERVEGSPSNVEGLPVGLLRRLVAEAGLDFGWP